jgi:chromosome partitioning protein
MQKGGVAKTTSTVNIASIAAHMRKDIKILVVDQDPQCNATGVFMEDIVSPSKTLYAIYQDLKIQKEQAEDLIHSTRTPNLFIVPSSLALAGHDYSTINIMDREWRLRKFIDLIKDKFDLIFVDTQPQLNIYTLNSLTACTDILIPLQPEMLAITGLEQLSGIINKVKNNMEEDINVLGVIITMLDARLNTHKQFRDQIVQKFGDKVLGEVHQCAALKEAVALHKTIGEHNKRSTAYKEYTALTKRIMKEVGLNVPSR